MFLLLYNLPVQIFQQVNLTLKSGVACFNQIYLVIIVVKATHHFEGDLLFAFRIQHQLGDLWWLLFSLQLE